jgi:hypothetical protein
LAKPAVSGLSSRPIAFHAYRLARWSVMTTGEGTEGLNTQSDKAYSVARMTAWAPDQLKAIPPESATV